MYKKLENRVHPQTMCLNIVQQIPNIRIIFDEVFLIGDQIIGISDYIGISYLYVNMDS